MAILQAGTTSPHGCRYSCAEVPSKDAGNGMVLEMTPDPHTPRPLREPPETPMPEPEPDPKRDDPLPSDLPPPPPVPPPPRQPNL